MAMLQGLSVSAKLMMGFALPRGFRAKAANPLWNHYRCGDDKWLCLGMLQPDRYWAEFSTALGHPELATDERFSDLRVRAQNAAAAVEILDGIFASKTREEWVGILRDGGDFIFTIVNSVDDLPTDPQVLANDYVVDFDHPQHGSTQMLGIPVRLSETPGGIRRQAPEFGEHTEEVLTGLLDYSWDEVAELRKGEVI
jgi:crotonobetainyl-CoA:carnitine CoA-transferase CaiB-like acyl-CoA transferase